jgi:hypothetical protein
MLVRPVALVPPLPFTRQVGHAGFFSFRNAQLKRLFVDLMVASRKLLSKKEPHGRLSRERFLEYLKAFVEKKWPGEPFPKMDEVHECSAGRASHAHWRMGAFS